MDIKKAFGLALQRVRQDRELTQEDFSTVSSRTYISTLERGVKSPTLEKMEDLSEELDIHLVTLLTITYLYRDSKVDKRTKKIRLKKKDLQKILKTIQREVEQIQYIFR